ncbi:hypothetical protein D3C86_1509510 [compost metagenome]
MRLVDDGFPFVELGVDEARDLCRRELGRRGIVVVEPFDVGFGVGAVDGDLVQFLQDGRRHAGGAEEAYPGLRFIARIAGFGDGGDIGQAGQAVF